MTACPSDIRKIRQHLAMAQTSVQPLRNVLITPLLVNSKSLDMVHEMTEQGTSAFFDSGGYYVQIGRLRFEELYVPLLNAYRANRWASVYTLPDHVPTSQDAPEIVERKVNDTIDFSTNFFHEMPDELKERAMPVVHGHTYKQVDKCLEAYLSLGIRRIGFGSFGTGGNKNETNIVHEQAINLVRYVIEVAHQHNIKVHLFGIGAPPLVAMMKGIRADSFDSSSWLKAAGFGMISLPFLRYNNITHRNGHSEFQDGIAEDSFFHLRGITGHRCRLCETIETLQSSKMNRAIHNLIVLDETVNMVNCRDRRRIEQIYQVGSIKYRREFEKWLSIS